MKLKKQAGRKGTGANSTPTRNPKIQFTPSIVLLEAAARNDLDEGMSRQIRNGYACLFS